MDALPRAVTKYCPVCGGANTLFTPLPDKLTCSWCDAEFHGEQTSRMYHQTLQAVRKAQRKK